MLLISGCEHSEHSEHSEHIKRVYKGGILPLYECRAYIKDVYPRYECVKKEM